MVVADFAVERIGAASVDCIQEAITADGHHVAFCPSSDGRLACSWDGQAGEPFDDVALRRDKTPAIFVSGDGRHIAYVGIRGGRPFVGRDNTEDPPVLDLSFSSPPTFDHFGRHLAYGARLRDGGPTVLVVDGVARENAVAPIRPALSPDGARLAYVEMRGAAQEDYQVRIVLDDVPGAWFRAMRNAAGALQFSPDGKRFAYYSVDGKGMARWTVDGVAQRWINDVRPLGLAQLRGVGVLDPPLLAAFSPDSRRFAYFADVVEKGVAIIEDDVAGPLVNAVGWPTFSHDSRRLAYVARTFQKRMVLILDGARVGEWEAADAADPVFSPDGRRVAVSLTFEEGGLLRKRRLMAVAVDERVLTKEPGDDNARMPAWSPDSTHVAWWIRRGEAAVLVVDGEVRSDAPAPTSDVVYDGAGRIAYTTADGGAHTVVVGGRRGPSATAVVARRPAHEVFDFAPITRARLPFRVSSTTGHVASAGAFGTSVQPVFDDEIGPAFDDIIDCTFGDDGSVTWWARLGADLLRVVRPAD